MSCTRPARWTSCIFLCFVVSLGATIPNKAPYFMGKTMIDILLRAMRANETADVVWTIADVTRRSIWRPAPNEL